MADVYAATEKYLETVNRLVNAEQGGAGVTIPQPNLRVGVGAAPNVNPMAGAAPGGVAPGLVPPAPPPPVDPFAQQQVLPTSLVVDAYVPPPNLGALPSTQYPVTQYPVTQYPVTQYSVPTDTPVTNADEFLEGIGDKLRNGGGNGGGYA